MKSLVVLIQPLCLASPAPGVVLITPSTSKLHLLEPTPVKVPQSVSSSVVLVSWLKVQPFLHTIFSHVVPLSTLVEIGTRLLCKLVTAIFFLFYC